MDADVVVGVDIGTSSSKGVLTDVTGRILHTVVREHQVQRPAPGHVEMDAHVWTREFVEMCDELVSHASRPVSAVGVSGMGPCVLLADDDDEPVRPAILYGVDTRAVEQIAAWDHKLGAETILSSCGSALTTQAAGPKITWIAEHEPDAYARAKRLFMPASWLVRQLTGEYVLDQHSASQCTPLYDPARRAWHHEWAPLVAPGIELPALKWSTEVAGWVTDKGAAETGLPAGIPVITGTIDAWSEAISADAHNVGDLMLMYGTTMFMINTIAAPAYTKSMWGTVGALPDTHNLAGGMATSGAITQWLRELFGKPEYADLVAAAEHAGPGAAGLLMLPYFAGERTPIMDPDARGVLAGLTLSHTRGDLYRAAMEATAYGIRHNVEVMREAGGDIRRIVAVGGGTQGGLWTQIVSDVTGLEQVVPTTTIGASYGSAYLAAQALGPADITSWNPPARTVHPDPARHDEYEQLYRLYRQLYTTTAEVAHELAARQHEQARTDRGES